MCIESEQPVSKAPLVSAEQRDELCAWLATPVAERPEVRRAAQQLEEKRNWLKSADLLESIDRLPARPTTVPFDLGAAVKGLRAMAKACDDKEEEGLTTFGGTYQGKGIAL